MYRLQIGRATHQLAGQPTWFLEQHFETAPERSAVERGLVMFDWTIVPGRDDVDATWTYNGARPQFDEEKFPLYAFVDGAGHFNDAPALGKPVPDGCPR